MFFAWHEVGIKWFINASNYTDFHKILAKKINSYLRMEDKLCDVGCGLGRIDLELAPYVNELTAVDINESVIKLIKRDAEVMKHDNLRAICCDATSLSETFDVLLLSFYGMSNIINYLKLCRRRLIRIVKVSNSSNLYPQKFWHSSRSTASTFQDDMLTKGIQFHVERTTIEFGQPLCSWQDAEQYVLYNAPNATHKEIETFLNDKLIETGKEDFPFYLPNPKELAIIIIEVDNKL